MYIRPWAKKTSSGAAELYRWWWYAKRSFYKGRTFIVTAFQWLFHPTAEKRRDKSEADSSFAHTNSEIVSLWCCIFHALLVKATCRLGTE